MQGVADAKVAKRDRIYKYFCHFFTLLYRKRTQRALSARSAGVVRALGAPARKRGRDRASVRRPRADASGQPSAGAGGARRERRREGASRANREHAAGAERARAHEGERRSDRTSRANEGEGAAAGAPRAGQGAPAPSGATPALSGAPSGAETGAAGLKSHCRTTLRLSAGAEQGAWFTSVNTSRFTNGNGAEHVHIDL